MGWKPLVPALLHLSQERLPTWTAVRPPRAGTSEWPAFGSADPHRPVRARSRTRFSGMGASPLFERIAMVRKGRASQGNQSLPNRVGRRCKKIRRYRACLAESICAGRQRVALPGGAEQILSWPASALDCCLDWLTHGSGRAGLAAGRAPRASTDAVGRYECRVEQSSRSPAEATKRREDKASLVSTASQETRGSRAVLMAAKEVCCSASL